MFESAGYGGEAATATTSSVGALTSSLARVIDELLDAGTDDMLDADLSEAMLALRRQQARLAAVVAEHTAAFEARRAYAAERVALGERLDGTDHRHVEQISQACRMAA